MRTPALLLALAIVVSRPVAAQEAREQTADQQVLHALNRVAFGPRPGDVERVRAMGVDQWIAQQLRPERIDDRAMERFLARYETQGMGVAELVREYPTPALARAMQQRDARGGAATEMTREDSVALRQAARRASLVGGELVSARVARAVASERQLQEVMTDFWENHFSVFAGKNGVMRHMLVSYDRDVIRPRALGSFRELLGAVAKSPAMLVYLDNALSVADSGRPTLAANGRMRPNGAGRGGTMPRRRPIGGNVLPGGGPRAMPGAPAPGARPDAMPQAQQRRRGLNENYARELLELHTLGVDGGYTQQDVIEVARAFTGWTTEGPRRGGDFVFRPQAHDAGDKTVLGHRLRAGRGIEDGEQVLDLLARHPATARFIATKLARRFVSDDPPEALVARAAETFRRTDGDIREVVRTIVTSPEFFSRAAWRAKVKSPFETVVSAARALGAEPDPTPRTAQAIARLGQPVFGRQAPDGWPETGGEWMNTGAILGRINFGLAVAADRLPGARLARWPEGAKLAHAPRDARVDGVIRALLGGDVSPDTRAILRAGSNPLLAAAPDAAVDVLDDSLPAQDAAEPETMPARVPGEGRRMSRRSPMDRVPELEGFAQVVGLALGAPEFQRR